MRAGLDDSVVLAGRFDDLAAFPDVVRNGLFDVHILARLHCPDGGEGMPMVGCGNGDDVHIFAFEKFAHVGKDLDADSLVFLVLLFLIENGVVHVAQPGDAAALDLGQSANVVLAPASEADDGDAHLIIGALDLCPRPGGPGNGGGREGRTGEEGTAGEFVHGRCGLWRGIAN